MNDITKKIKTGFFWILFILLGLGFANIFYLIASVNSISCAIISVLFAAETLIVLRYWVKYDFRKK